MDGSLQCMIGHKLANVEMRMSQKKFVFWDVNTEKCFLQEILSSGDN